MTVDLAGPNPVDAEQACLGALVKAPELVRLVPSLRPRHFFDPRHRHVMAAVLTAAARDDVVPDEMVVFEALTNAGVVKPPHLDFPFLMDLMNATPVLLNVAWYARTVLEAARRRALLSVVAQAQEAAALAADEDDLAGRMEVLCEQISTLTVPVSVTGAGRIVGFHQLAEFVDTPPGVDGAWVIPGLLRSMERVVVVASEGAGKTMLARTVATATAAGRHFLEPDSRIPPQRTLMVDLENPPSLIRKKTGPMIGELRRMSAWDSAADDRAWLWSRPGGIDLRRPEDAAALARVVEKASPQLVCFGPVYKAFNEGAGDRAEQAAREVVSVLDRLREKHRFALWVEHHAPLEQQGTRRLRPFGSALWSRWPEFGIALRITEPGDPACTSLAVERWRGDRDEREWPTRLDRGRHGWPFTADWTGHPGGMPDWLRYTQPYEEMA